MMGYRKRMAIGGPLDGEYQSPVIDDRLKVRVWDNIVHQELVDGEFIKHYYTDYKILGEPGVFRKGHVHILVHESLTIYQALNKLFRRYHH